MGMLFLFIQNEKLKFRGAKWYFNGKNSEGAKKKNPDQEEEGGRVSSKSRKDPGDTQRLESIERWGGHGRSTRASSFWGH